MGLNILILFSIHLHFMINVTAMTLLNLYKFS